MTIDKLTRSDTEEPRSTAYYYADLERFKRTNHEKANSNTSEPKRRDVKLTNSTESDAKRNLKLSLERRPELPQRQCSLPNYRTDRNIPDYSISRNVPEYSTPEGRQGGETYSTAGTFPMQKEKEPLLAELEVVGRVPLTQLSSSQVRRSRSWYFCCPEVGEEEVSQSSWRYSSLRPVTAPPAPRTNDIAPSPSLSTHTALTAERDALARALTLERERSLNESRAYEERVTELHGVIAELMRRRDGDRKGRISEGSGEDECESTTQPADGVDPDEDRTEQNDTFSAVSPLEMSEALHVGSHDQCHRDLDNLNTTTEEDSDMTDRPYETCLRLTELDQDSLTANRCTRGSSCERERGSVDDRFTAFTTSPGRFESRQAKLASRIKLRRTGDTEVVNDDSWCADAVEKLSLEMCADADVREVLAAAGNHDCCKSAMDELLSARVNRLEADITYLTTALHTATDTAARLSTSCSAHEAATNALCLALKSSDRAIEIYDVLLALAESKEGSEERRSAEEVASSLLEEVTLEELEDTGEIGGVPGGPWASYRTHTTSGEPRPWSEAHESRLRGHVERLKKETTTYRGQGTPPLPYHYTEIDKSEIPERTGDVGPLDMEKAIMIQEVVSSREDRAAAMLELTKERARSRVLAHRLHQLYLSSSNRRKNKKEKQRHWLETASETDL